MSIYQSSAKSLGIDAGDGQRDDVNTRWLQDISKIESPKIEYRSQSRVELGLAGCGEQKANKGGSQAEQVAGE